MPLPKGYHLEWAGEYESQQRADKRMAMIVPLTVLLIFLILYTMFRSFKWAVLILVTVAHGSVGGSLALLPHPHQLQRLLQRRLPRALRRLGANRRHHARVHQSIARARRITPIEAAASKAQSCVCAPS